MLVKRWWRPLTRLRIRHQQRDCWRDTLHPYNSGIVVSAYSYINKIFTAQFIHLPFVGLRIIDRLISELTLTIIFPQEHGSNSMACQHAGTERVEGTFVNNPSTWLLAISRKKFPKVVGFSTYSGFDTATPWPANLIMGADERKVANGERIASPKICVDLCHLHPKCKIASFHRPMDCGLTVGPHRLFAHSDIDSYVSWNWNSKQSCVVSIKTGWRLFANLLVL